MTTPLRPAVRARWLAFNFELEGCISKFYLCTAKRVTIAYGCMFPTAESAVWLPMLRADGTAATPLEIAEDWRRIDARPELATLGWREAAKVAQLHLSPEGIEAVTYQRLEDFGRRLAQRFSDFASYPADAQMAILSLAWACGTDFKYPKCEAAIRRRAWAEAAEECRIRVPDLQVRSAEQKKHFLYAQVVEDNALDPTDLYDPTAAGYDPLPLVDREALAAHAAAWQATNASVNEAIADGYRSDR